MSNQPLVSIIIVNWNGLEYLRDCFCSLEKNDYPNYEIIFVDNGSVDDSVKFVKENFPETIIIQNKNNLGFVGGNNEGYKYAKGKYILFLNNDTFVENNFLSLLVKAVEKDEKIGSVQPKLVRFDKQTLDSAGSYLTDLGIFYHYGFLKDKNKEIYNKPRKIFSGKGAALLFSRKVLEIVGLFDEDFFNYFEESDLCWRVWLAGYEVIYLPESVVYHKIGGTAGRSEEGLASLIGFHSYKNRVCSLIKNLGFLRLIKILPLHIFVCFVISILFLFKGQFKYTFNIARALIWNIANIRKTWTKRAYIQKNIRKVSDKKLFPIIKKNPNFLYYLAFFNILSAAEYKDKIIE